MAGLRAETNAMCKLLSQAQCEPLHLEHQCKPLHLGCLEPDRVDRSVSLLALTTLAYCVVDRLDCAVQALSVSSKY